MNIKAFFCAATLALAAFALPTDAAPKRTPAHATASLCELDGIIFKHCRYTILTVAATSYRDSEDGAYDHTVMLRFHRDDSRRVDIKVLAPGDDRQDWGANDEWATYCTMTDSPDYPQARLHYSFEEQGANDLQLHVLSVAKAAVRKGIPMSSLKLTGSSYTYAIGGGSKLFTYELAENAVITGCNK